MRELTQELGNKLEEVAKQAESEQLPTYGLAIFSYAAGELRRGLQEHTTLSVDVDATIARLRAMEGEAAELMQASKLSIDHIDTKLRPALDQLKRSNSSRMVGWWYTKEYEQAKRSLSAQLSDYLDATRAAVQARKYGLAGQHVAVIQHIFSTLHAHLEHRLHDKWRGIKNVILREIDAQCEAVKGALMQG